MSRAGRAESSESEWGDSADGGEWSDRSSLLGSDEGAVSSSAEDDDADADTPTCCRNKCLQAKPAKYRALRASVRAMSKTERVTCILTMMNIAAQVATYELAQTEAVSGDRDRFIY
jgi:hypothetical protein